MSNDSMREQRKNEHVEIAMAQPESIQSDFDRVRFVHHSIPSIAVSDVDLSVSFDDAWTLKHPLYINAMTGGSKWTQQINEKLAYVARDAQLAMAVGSTHAALRNDDLSDSYRIVRDVNPNGMIWSNVGADVPVELAVKAVDLLEAQALQVHVNAPQELVMPEGNRTFEGWIENIAAIVARVSVPVIVKEVGFGMSKETIQALYDVGVRYVDVSGTGGTNFVHIENARRTLQDMSYLEGWGQSTVISLLESRQFQQDMHIMASGGVRHPLDAMKACALGAKAVGMSRPFLLSVEEQGVEETIAYAENFTSQMRTIATMLNAKDMAALQQADMVLDPYLDHWCAQRL